MFIFSVTSSILSNTITYEIQVIYKKKSTNTNNQVMQILNYFFHSGIFEKYMKIKQHGTSALLLSEILYVVLFKKKSLNL